jgi:lipoprotein signal peptidase/chaperone LolA
MRLLALILGAGVFLLDLLTKWWVQKTFWLHYYPVLEGHVTIQYVRNEGIAFGLFHDVDSQLKPVLLSAVAVLALGVVLYYLYTTPRSERLTFLALGLLLGGISGNFVDRLLNGYVVDFLTLHWQDKFAWPTFNVADAAITTGVALILFRTFALEGGTHRSASMFLAAGLAAAAPVSPSVGDLVARLQSTYEEITSFRAEFTQTIRSRGISQSESGIVLMKRPGRMYWEYREPLRKYFVADGRRTYFYVPRDKQLLVSDLNLQDSDSPLLFLLGRGDIQRDFMVSMENQGGADESRVILRLTPRVPQPDFSYLLLELSRSELLIRRLTVVEPIGQENEYVLTNIERNVQIPDRQFRLDVSADVEVIEQ